MYTLGLLHLYPHLSLSLCYNQKLQYCDGGGEDKVEYFSKMDIN